MKKIITLITIIFVFNLSAQDIKKEERIISKNGSYLTQYKVFKDGKNIDTYSNFIARDDRYKQIIEMCVLYKGDVRGFIFFLEELLKTFKYEKNTTVNLDNNRVYVRHKEIDVYSLKSF